MSHEDTSNSQVTWDHFNEKLARDAESLKALANYLKTLTEQFYLILN